MKPVRVIAWGNAGRCDDGAALVLADRLIARGLPEKGVIIHSCHQLAPELAEDLHDCRLAIFVDAHRRSESDDLLVERVVPDCRAGLDTHRCSPGALLALTESLGLKVPESWLVAIRGYDWEFGDTLSPATTRTLDLAERAVLDLLAAQVSNLCSTG